MKALKYSLIILFVFSVTLGFSQNRKAAKYNDKIITEQHRIAEEMLRFFKNFKTASLEDIKKQRSALVSRIDKSVDKVKSMGAFESDAQLRDGALSLFAFYKSTLEKEYNEMIPLIANRGRSDEDNKKLEQHKNDLISKEEEMDNKFALIQEEFAARHMLILKKEEIKQ